MVSLYEMQEEYMHLLAADVSTIEEAQAWNDSLALLTGQIDVKVTNIALLVKQLQAEETMISDEIDRLREKKEARQNKVGWLKRYMLGAMQLAGIDKTTDVRAEVRLQKNPPSVDVLADTLIPRDYWIPQEPRLDKQALRDALKAGEDIPGARLVQTVGVRIK
jgi:hypothetical protein